MKTPKEMANAVVDCWINDSEGNYVQGDPEKAAAALLTAWRDECVAAATREIREQYIRNLGESAAAAMRTEAPADDDDWDKVDDAFDEMAKSFSDVAGEFYERRSFQRGGSWMKHLILKLILSRAPRAESPADDAYAKLLKAYVDMTNEREFYLNAGRQETVRAETAEAKCDGWKAKYDEARIIQSNIHAKAIKLKSKLEAVEAERDKRIAQLDEMVIMKDKIVSERDRLHEENKALRGCLKGWQESADLEGATGTLVDETNKLLRAKGKDDV